MPWGAGSLARLALAPDGQVLPACQVRYCALGMDEGRNPYGSFDPDDIAEDDYTYMEQRPDRYLLAFWPAEGRPERIVRQTSNAAAYWHDWASALPAPPALGELVEAESRLQEERLRRSEEKRRARELRMWAGHSVLPMMLGLTSLWAAADPDPLRAALDALYAALTTQGPMHDAFFAEVRRVFPSVAR